MLCTLLTDFTYPMSRITISIPNKLHERLRDPRVRKSINISRVCQEAIDREVRRIADLPLDLERVEGILARIRQELHQTDEQWFSWGVQAARDWIEHEAPYALLRQLGEVSQEKRRACLQTAPPGALDALLAKHRDEPGFSERSFLDGWAQMTGLLWEVIKKNL